MTFGATIASSATFSARCAIWLRFRSSWPWCDPAAPCATMRVKCTETCGGASAIISTSTVGFPGGTRKPMRTGRARGSGFNASTSYCRGPFLPPSLESGVRLPCRVAVASSSSPTICVKRGCGTGSSPVRMRSSVSVDTLSVSPSESIPPQICTARRSAIIGTSELFIAHDSRLQPLRDLFQHHLGGAAADRLHARVARHALDGRLAEIPRTAVELQAVVHHFVHQLAAVGLHHGHFFHAVLALGVQRRG